MVLKDSLKLDKEEIYFVNFCLKKLEPENTEDYIDYLKSVGWLDEAATRLAFIVNKVLINATSYVTLWHKTIQRSWIAQSHYTTFKRDDALNINFRNSLCGPIYISNLIDKTILSNTNTPHQHNTIVSLENYPL